MKAKLVALFLQPVSVCVGVWLGDTVGVCVCVLETVKHDDYTKYRKSVLSANDEAVKRDCGQDGGGGDSQGGCMRRRAVISRGMLSAVMMVLVR